MHGVRNSLLDRQIAALGLPCIKIPIPNACTNEIYDARMAAADRDKSNPKASNTSSSAICSSKTFAHTVKSGSPKPECTASFRSGNATRERSPKK